MNAFTSINSKYNLAMHVDIVQLDLKGTILHLFTKAGDLTVMIWAGAF